MLCFWFLCVRTMVAAGDDDDDDDEDKHDDDGTDGSASEIISSSFEYAQESKNFRAWKIPFPKCFLFQCTELYTKSMRKRHTLRVNLALCRCWKQNEKWRRIIYFILTFSVYLHRLFTAISVVRTVCTVCKMSMLCSNTSCARTKRKRHCGEMYKNGLNELNSISLRVDENTKKNLPKFVQCTV